MQLSFPLSEVTGDRSAPVEFVRHRRARRYLLRVLPDGTVRVTLPRWGLKREAQAFVDASRDWIARQRARHSVRPAQHESWGEGTSILLDGCRVGLRVDRDADGVHVWCGDARIATRARLASDLRPLVEAWLRTRARRELPRALLALAAAHAIDVPRVSVRNQRSRWGACSPTGTITLNWRLVQTPPLVREYVLLHELMHRRELNHSRRFWRLVAACCPHHADARQWLRTEGKSLWSDRDSR